MTAPDILLRITGRRRQRIAEAGAADAAGWTEGAPRTPSDNAFLGHLKARRRDPAIIAEVKMGSPRLGSLHGRVDPVSQARLYAANGALSWIPYLVALLVAAGFIAIAISRINRNSLNEDQ